MEYNEAKLPALCLVWDAHRNAMHWSHWHREDGPRRANCAIKHMHAIHDGWRLVAKMYNICVNTAFLENIIKIMYTLMPLDVQYIILFS